MSSLQESRKRYVLAQKKELSDKIEEGLPVIAAIRLNAGTSSEDYKNALREIRKYAKVIAEPIVREGSYPITVMIKNLNKGRRLLQYCDANLCIEYFQPCSETRAELLPDIEYCFG